MSLAIPLACLVAGAVVMVAFESAPLRALGVLLLVAFVVTGLLAIATPDNLERDDEDVTT